MYIQKKVAVQASSYRSGVKAVRAYVFGNFKEVLDFLHASQVTLVDLQPGLALLLFHFKILLQQVNNS